MPAMHCGPGKRFRVLSASQHLPACMEDLPLTYDFYNPLFQANMGNFDATLRLKLWKEYAASIGATENTDAMGARSGHPDGFGFTGVYRLGWP
jgi:hypothetical protein